MVILQIIAYMEIVLMQREWNYMGPSPERWW